MTFAVATPDNSQSFIHFSIDQCREYGRNRRARYTSISEMKALFLAIKSFVDVVTNHRVTAMCDNSTVVAYVDKQGGTVSNSLCSLTGQLLRWTESHDVHLEARYRYLPGQSNVLADLLSRRNQVLGAEWSLHPQVARKLI